MPTRFILAPLALLAMLAVAACGGPPQTEATPIPASVVRPVQPTPAYPSNARLFTRATPQRTPIFIEPTAAPVAASLSAVESGPGNWTALLAIEQPPSAVGIAPGGATIYETPGGRVLKSVSSAGVLNVTGISEDGRWLSVYDESAIFGWTPVGQLVLFGAEDLTVVQEAVDPGQAAQLIVDVMQPVEVLDSLMETLEATPAATPAAP